MRISRVAAVAVMVVCVLSACSGPKESLAPVQVEEQKFDPRVQHREFAVHETGESLGGAAVRSAEDRDVLFWRHHEGKTVVREKSAAVKSDEFPRGDKAKSKDASAYAQKDVSVYKTVRKDSSVYSIPQKSSRDNRM